MEAEHVSTPLGGGLSAEPCQNGSHALRDLTRARQGYVPGRAHSSWTRAKTLNRPMNALPTFLLSQIARLGVLLRPAGEMSKAQTIEEVARSTRLPGSKERARTSILGGISGGRCPEDKVRDENRRVAIQGGNIKPTCRTTMQEKSARCACPGLATTGHLFHPPAYHTRSHRAPHRCRHRHHRDTARYLPGTADASHLPS